MFSSFPKLWCFAGILALIGSTPSFGQELRVCSDPDNLPFSNIQKKGFENELAEMVAGELHRRLTYVWQRMGRGFVRDYINQSKCDLLIGVPANFRMVDTTRPYYRSTYVFLVRKDAGYKPTSLDDPALKKLRIGVQALDEQYTPPGEVLVKRGLQEHLKAFHSVGGDADAIIQAVVNREVDVALVWGPLGGYSARRMDPLQIIPLHPERESEIPFTFEISMGVKKGNEALRSAIQTVLERKSAAIAALLDRYGVPQLPIMRGQSAELQSIK
jgi:mxaJ protein